jgi:excisionase family DNA binding protein
MENKDFYKVSEVAKIMSVSRLTAYRWIKEGKIKVVRIGKTMRIPRKEIERILQQEEK